MSGAPSSAAAAFLHAGGRSHCRPWCLLHLTAEQKLFPDCFCSSAAYSYCLGFQAEPAGQSPQALLSGSPARGHTQSSQVAAAFQPPRLFFIASGKSASSAAAFVRFNEKLGEFVHPKGEAHVCLVLTVLPPGGLGPFWIQFYSHQCLPAGSSQPREP